VKNRIQWAVFHNLGLLEGNHQGSGWHFTHFWGIEGKLEGHTVIMDKGNLYVQH